jgi:hypothetical protein
MNNLRKERKKLMGKVVRLKEVDIARRSQSNFKSSKVAMCVIKYRGFPLTIS